MDTMYADYAGDGFCTCSTYAEGRRFPLLGGLRVSTIQAQFYADRHDYRIVWVSFP